MPAGDYSLLTRPGKTRLLWCQKFHIHHVKVALAGKLTDFGTVTGDHTGMCLLEHYLVTSVADPSYRHEGPGDSCHLECRSKLALGAYQVKLRFPFIVDSSTIHADESSPGSRSCR